MTALHCIAVVPYRYFREEAAKGFWYDLKPYLRSAIFNVYKQQSIYFCDMIQQEYRDIYGDKDSQRTATILLDIFLEVPPAPKMTSNYCQTLRRNMEESMNRCDQLIFLIRIGLILIYTRE